MLRTSFIKQARCYATDNKNISIADLDALLDRVKSLTSDASKTINSKNNNQRRQPRPRFQGKDTARESNFKSKPSKSFKPQSQPQPFKSKIGAEFDKIPAELIQSDSFVPNVSTQAGPNTSRQPRLKSKFRKQQTSNQPRSSSPTSSPNSFGPTSRRTFTRPQSKNKTTSRNKSRASRSSALNESPLVNLNYDNIPTSYTPEVPTIQDLVSLDSLTSLNQESRILKGLLALKNGESNLEGVINGKFKELNVSTTFKDQKSILNSNVVLNSLNSNPSINHDAKVKILGPLIGLAPVNQLK